MNWVGGARNRVKGAHKNELRLQKEFFERKRLQRLNQSSHVGDGETNREKHKLKVSQDIISFQRQCRLNNRQDINTTPNFRRVDLKSRSFSKGVNKFGVKTVELPMSPVDKPSLLYLSSPPRNNRPTLFRHGPVSHHCSTKAAASYAMKQSTCIDLFGETTLTPHASINNELKQANLGTFDNKAGTYTTSGNEPYGMLVSYRPRESSRDFPSPLSPESEYGRENHTVPNSLYPPMFSNELPSFYECPNPCQQCHKHNETDFRHISSFQVDPHFDHNTTTCQDDGNTQPLFGDKKKKSKFCVRIVPSPESQRSLSSETSTLNSWSQTNDARRSDQHFNQFQLPNERDFSIFNSSQMNYSGLDEPNGLAQWQQQQQTSKWHPHTHEHNSCSEQTNMTNLKETHPGNSLCYRQQSWTNYNRQAAESFPTPPSNYCEQAPSTCFVVSAGLDSTPKTSNHRHVPTASPFKFGQGKIFQKAGLDTNRDGQSTALVRLQSRQNTIQSEDPIESTNPGKQITKSSLNSLRSPAEIPAECKQSNTSNIHSTGRKSLKADERKIVRDTPYSQVSVSAAPSCKSSSSNETLITQEVSNHKLKVEKDTIDIRNSTQIVDTLDVDLDICKSVIVSPCDIRNNHHVTSSADVAHMSQSKELTGISDPICLSICTQTTPKVYTDTASSPIKEVVGKLTSSVIDDSLISSSMCNIQQYQPAQG